MTGLAQEIHKRIDSISPVERAELIEELIRSFDRDQRMDIDAKWVVEAESRNDAYSRGEITASSMEDVFRRINQR